jgi:hypothetical protein
MRRKVVEISSTKFIIRIASPETTMYAPCYFRMRDRTFYSLVIA